jgi:hypothetical protein
MAGRRHNAAPARILRSGAVAATGAAAALGLSLIGGASVASAASPSGSEFQVNTYTTASQRHPSVARDAAGNFFVVWQSQGSFGDDTSGTSIQGQRYDATGAPIGGQFQVNAGTGNDQTNPRVAFDPAGNSVVVWENEGAFPVSGRRYDASGAPVGTFSASFASSYARSHRPAVASLSADNFVVVWEHDMSFGGQSSVLAQHFNSGLLKIGPVAQVNTYTPDFQGAPSIATDSTDDYVVVWESDGGGSDDSGSSIQGQRYDANLAPVGGNFQVNTYTTADQGNPSIAADATGNFVVAWDSYGSDGTDGSTWSIQGQRYDAGFSPVGGQFQVNSFTTGAQDYPSVASDAAGEFAVVWQSQVHGATDAADVQGRIFDATGGAVGADFQVNTYTTSIQSYPAVASDALGNFAVTWESLGSPDTDSSSHSVQAQRYLPEPALAQSFGAMVAMLITLARRKRPTIPPSRTPR